MMPAWATGGSPLRARCLASISLCAALMAPAASHAHPSTVVPNERTERVTSAEIRGCKKPSFPYFALRNEQKGQVTVAFLVDVDGKVIDALVRKSSRHSLLDAAAIDGIKQCQFKPRSINGNPSSGWLLVTYNWTLEPSPGDEVPLQRLQSKALDGDLEAVYQLAMAYRSEFNDSRQAMIMLREAAEHNHPGAIYEVADAMWHGRELPVDQTKALSYYMAAAQLGHAQSQYEIAEAYAFGHGVARNQAKAMAWYIKAAEQGFPDAQIALADVLAEGAGGVPDYQAAVNWYRKAAQGGDDLAQRKLAQYYLIGKGVEKDVAQAVVWLRKAVEQGQPKAQAVLAVLYLQGEGVPVNNEEALRLLQRAAIGGDVGAMILLGDLLRKGERTAADPASAAIWYRRAADRGDSAAAERLKAIKAAN